MDVYTKQNSNGTTVATAIERRRKWQHCDSPPNSIICSAYHQCFCVTRKIASVAGEEMKILEVPLPFKFGFRVLRRGGTGRRGTNDREFRKEERKEKGEGSGEIDKLRDWAGEDFSSFPSHSSVLCSSSLPHPLSKSPSFVSFRSIRAAVVTQSATKPKALNYAQPSRPHALRPNYARAARLHTQNSVRRVELDYTLRYTFATRLLAWLVKLKLCVSRRLNRAFECWWSSATLVVFLVFLWPISTQLVEFLRS
ncbi:hypothetical protein BDQ12DRAFT_397195 [Crucibulum laeve]|uniref:Uncharacterized protein n=1 Tax=Crucibulum laeve TaxID=68775 RepID=A0A5C3MAM8_9AGAR|nr:hypothetical protein BDQ12DRAFT_397195 [Crucibulum laeve]